MFVARISLKSQILGVMGLKLSSLPLEMVTSRMQGIVSGAQMSAYAETHRCVTDHSTVPHSTHARTTHGVCPGSLCLSFPNAY